MNFYFGGRDEADDELFAAGPRALKAAEDDIPLRVRQKRATSGRSEVTTYDPQSLNARNSNRRDGATTVWRQHAALRSRDVRFVV